MEHPISDLSLRRFASGTVSREEGRAVFSHLLRGCAPCSRKLSALTGFVVGPVKAQAPAAPMRAALRQPVTVQ